MFLYLGANLGIILVGSLLILYHLPGGPLFESQEDAVERRWRDAPRKKWGSPYCPDPPHKCPLPPDLNCVRALTPNESHLWQLMRISHDFMANEKWQREYHPHIMERIEKIRREKYPDA